MSTRGTAAEFFGGMVESYDSLIRRAVPRYDEMIDRLLEHLPGGSMRILELGCGTGNLTLRLAEQFPKAVITTVDAAPEMTALTAARGTKAGVGPDRLRTVTGRFEEVSFPDGSFDLVTSCMSLHHVKDKLPVYRAIHEWLAPRGWFCFGDQLLGGTEEIQNHFWDQWLAFCRQPGNCSEDEIASLIEHAAAHDHYVPLVEHLRMLREAGFVEMDCVWRSLMYSVVVGRAG